MRVVVLTTSWPRTESEFAGRFVADAVERLRERGVEVDVLAPGAGYDDHGLAYGGGMAANLRRRPWAAPLMLVSMLRSLRRAARGADLVHAHWLLTAAVARFGGKPFVVTLHGSGSAGSFSDVELARRRPGLVRFLLRPAAAAICVSETVAAYHAPPRTRGRRSEGRFILIVRLRTSAIPFGEIGCARHFGIALPLPSFR